MAMQCRAQENSIYWGSAAKTERCFEAIAKSYGPFPDLRVLPPEASKDGMDGTFYPRDVAHALFGLGVAVFKK